MYIIQCFSMQGRCKPRAKELVHFVEAPPVFAALRLQKYEKESTFFTPPLKNVKYSKNVHGAIGKTRRNIGSVQKNTETPLESRRGYTTRWSDIPEAE